jgi:hypothetical protein
MFKPFAIVFGAVFVSVGIVGFIMCQKTAAFRPGLNGSLERTQALVSA